MKLLLFKDKDELLKSVEEQVQHTTDELKHAAKLYNLARYFVAVYESHYGKILLQVWNEYRNAIDHFFRYQTSQHKDEAARLQLRKMEGHLQRAVFDALKLVCHRTIDRVDVIMHKYGKREFDYVDNAKYLPKLTKDLNSAKEQLSTAKTSDDALGGSLDNDDDVLGMYLNAAILAHKISSEFSEKEILLQKARSNYWYKGLAIAIAVGLFTGVGGNYIYSHLTFEENEVANTCPKEESKLSPKECLDYISGLVPKADTQTTDTESLMEFLNQEQSTLEFSGDGKAKLH